jgi:predicted extracellular nuclease
MSEIKVSILKALKSTIVPIALTTSSLAIGHANANVIINEVDADQTSTDNAEFIELYDGGVGLTDLTGLSLVLYNGSDNKSYLAYDLDGYQTNADGYFVLCGDANNTPNCDLDVSKNTNLIQNGADAVILVTGDSSDYPNDTVITTDNLIDALVYDTNDSDDADLLVFLNSGQPQVNEGGNGNKDTDSNQRCVNGSGGAFNTDTYEQHIPTPGAENTCGIITSVSNLGVCADPASFIHDVQGNGLESPLVGQVGVIVEGVVIAAYQGSDSLGGYYIQEEDTDQDKDASTSEGIFIADTVNIVNAGDVVRVEGTVVESYALTSFENVTDMAVCSTNATVTATSVTLPVASLDDFESVEGMLVTLSQPLTVNDNYTLGRYGEVTVSDGRTYQFTHNNEPNVEGYAVHNENVALNQLILGDANSKQNPETIIFPQSGLSASNTLRAGYTTLVEGVLSYAFGSYRIEPTDEISFTADNPRTATPEDLGGNFKVASANVLNYFTTLDVDGAVCGPSNLGCRGANNSEEFTRQRDKTIKAIIAINADILGLVELENNATASLADLVSGLNDVAGPNTYAFLNTGTIGTDAIKVGFIYKPASATLVGDFAILDSTVDPTFIDSKSRPTLAQTFSTTSGEKLTLAINHFKSKGSSCDALGDVDLNDGQGNCASTRASAATALVNWLATDPTNSDDPDFLILGDLNAYAMENAVTNITSSGYTNLIDAFVGSTAYSYLFGGEAGYLDHALASTELTAKVTDVTEWHINADEPVVLDYNTEFQSTTQQAKYYAPDAYRMSDHDPIIIGFDFTPAAVLGDFDNDGDVDIDDVYGLMRAVQQRLTIDMVFDLNNDETVSIMDARVMMTLCTNTRCARN